MERLPPYDRLIIATGSTPFMLPIPSADKYGVIGFRDISGVDTMLEASEQYKKAVVIGGGLLGLEAANGLMKQGMDVTVEHLMDRLMERQLDKPAAKMLQKSLESGLHCERGIVVNDTMQTFDPRNCAEATIKDFGVVCVESGYELHVGGIKVRVTDFLTKVETEEEVLEYCGAFSQLYREDAHYLERTAPWVERVGLKKIKDAIIDDEENRKALHARFLISQKPAQIDPWKAHAEGKNANEFAPIVIA